MKIKFCWFTWSSLFKVFFESVYQIEIANIENINKDYLDFWIGPIIKVNNKSVSIHNYDPNGILYDNPTLIKYASISVVQFGDNYSTTFRKYLRNKKKI